MVNYLWKTMKDHVNVEGSHIIIWRSPWNKRSWGGVAALYYSWRESWRHSKFGKATTKCPNFSGESTQMHINQFLARDSLPSPLCSHVIVSAQSVRRLCKILYLQITMTKRLIWESTDEERPISNTTGERERGDENVILMTRVIWKWYGRGRTFRQCGVRTSQHSPMQCLALINGY